MEFLNVVLKEEDTLGISGEKKAVEFFIELYNREDFWDKLDEDGCIGFLDDIRWDSLVCSIWMGSCDGDIFYFLPLTPKYKARWGSPMLRLSEDMNMFAPEGHPLHNDSDMF